MKYEICLVNYKEYYKAFESRVICDVKRSALHVVCAFR